MTGPGPQILVVEDDPSMRRFLRTALATHHFRILEESTAAAAYATATREKPDLVLLDLGLPDGDGIDLAARLRAWSQAPILVISARGREEDKVKALDAGADDYLTKPFGLGELLARIRVGLRHARGQGPAQPVRRFGPLTVDLARRTVTVAEREVHLTPIEWDLLAVLVRNAGRVVTHGSILREVWGPGHADQAHYVRVYMGGLRKKLEADPARPALLVTEPGVGYRLRDDGEPGGPDS